MLNVLIFQSSGLIYGRFLKAYVDFTLSLLKVLSTNDFPGFSSQGLSYNIKAILEHIP